MPASVTPVQRHLLNDELREVAISLDKAHQAAIPTLLKGDINLDMATAVVRAFRRQIEHLEEIGDVSKCLQEMDYELGSVAGSAAIAVAKARSQVAALSATLIRATANF